MLSVIEASVILSESIPYVVRYGESLTKDPVRHGGDSLRPGSGHASLSHAENERLGINPLLMKYQHEMFR
jgi:hypothetical protein